MTLDSSKITQANLLRCREAMGLLYQTFIEDSGNAELRGMAITAIERMILNMGGESAVENYEAVPFTKRMRESGDPELVSLAKDLALKAWDKASPLEAGEEDD